MSMEQDWGLSLRLIEFPLDAFEAGTIPPHERDHELNLVEICVKTSEVMVEDYDAHRNGTAVPESFRAGVKKGRERLDKLRKETGTPATSRNEVAFLLLTLFTKPPSAQAAKSAGVRGEV